MIDKVFIYKDNMGRVQIGWFAANVYTDGKQFWTPREGEKPLEGFRLAELPEIAERHCGHKNFIIIKESDLPDLDFQDSFVIRSNYVSVDIGKARQVHMDRIREARDLRLIELDKRNYGPEFDAERTMLRDLPKTFDLSKAKTTEELKILWPSSLSRS